MSDQDPLPSPKQRQVLEAARMLFMAHGYGPVSMEMVAKQAQVSKATLYAYFPSKDRLFATIVGDACLRASVDESSYPTEIDDIGAALREIGERLLRFLLQPNTMAIYRVVVAESARFPELGAAFMAAGPQAFLNRFTLWLRGQMAAGHLAIDDVGMAAEQFGAMLRSSHFMRATLGLTDPADDAAGIEHTVREAVATFLCRYRATQEG